MLLPSDQGPRRGHADGSDHGRPPAARRLVAVLATLVLAPLMAVAMTAASPSIAAADTPVALTGEEQAHLDLLNAYRRDRGLPAVAVDARVQADTRRWTRAMADRGDLAHDPGLREACFAASSTCAGWSENVGVAGDHARVFQLFAGSSGHARNMATSSPDTPVRVGIGVLRSGGQTWVVQRFVRCWCENDDLANRLNGDRANALAFAESLHQDFLGTSGSSVSLDHVAAPLAYGVERWRVVERLAYSDAWVGAMVDRFYRATLGRAPDADGRSFWIDAIRRGQSPAEVAARFYASGEYYAAVGGSDRAWVEALYEALLGRRGDAGGVDHWVQRLRAGTTRSAVAVDFYQSVESRRVRVVGLYDLLLDRRPDARGLEHWVARLADGQDVRLAIELAGSGEYLQRAIARHG